MVDQISFEENRTKLTSVSNKGLVGFMINKLGVKDESVANIILVVVALIIFGISALIFINSLA